VSPCTGRDHSCYALYCHLAPPSPVPRPHRYLLCFYARNAVERVHVKRDDGTALLFERYYACASTTLTFGAVVTVLNGHLRRPPAHIGRKHGWAGHISSTPPLLLATATNINAAESNVPHALSVTRSPAGTDEGRKPLAARPVAYVAMVPGRRRGWLRSRIGFRSSPAGSRKPRAANAMLC
jgi:hypothetical protein